MRSKRSGQPDDPVHADRGRKCALGAVLSAASLDADAGHRALRLLQAQGLEPEHFALASHGELYRLLVSMMADGIPVDAVSVACEIDREHADPHLIPRCEPSSTRCQRSARPDVMPGIVVDAALRRETEEREA